MYYSHLYFEGNYFNGTPGECTGLLIIPVVWDPRLILQVLEFHLF